MLQKLEKEIDDVDATIGDQWRILDRYIHECFCYYTFDHGFECEPLPTTSFLYQSMSIYILLIKLLITILPEIMTVK